MDSNEKEGKYIIVCLQQPQLRLSALSSNILNYLKGEEHNMIAFSHSDLRDKGTL